MSNAKARRTAKRVYLDAGAGRIWLAYDRDALDEVTKANLVKLPLDDDVGKALVPADVPALPRYESACREIAACVRIDEAKDIHDKAVALKVYAKQAKNPQLEADAWTIRKRAERRLGELSLALDKAEAHGGRIWLPSGGKSKSEALADAGISTSSAHRYEQNLKVPESEWEALIAKGREQIIAGHVQADATINAAIKAKTRPPKPISLIGDVTGDDLQILVGDCREKMKELPKKSVHCCITSPPYFALRSYDVEATIWGGDKNCEHEWTTHERFGMGGMSSRERVRGTHGFDASEYSFCRKCGAWRGCLGLEPTPELYVEHICQVFDEVWRVLRDDGTLWLNIGDSYAASTSAGNLKPKDLIGIPWMTVFALRARGWHLRSEIIWHKRNPTPESVTDRPTKVHETVFLLTKKPNYYFDHEAVKEPAVSEDDPRGKGTRNTYNGKFGKKAFAAIPEDDKRNVRTVWPIANEPLKDFDHFAPFPKNLVRPMVLAGCPRGGVVLDCFAGTGTTGIDALALGRKAVLIEANPEYAAMAQQRIDKELAKYKAKCAGEDAWGNVINRDDVALDAAG